MDKGNLLKNLQQLTAEMNADYNEGLDVGAALQNCVKAAEMLRIRCETLTTHLVELRDELKKVSSAQDNMYAISKEVGMLLKGLRDKAEPDKDDEEESYF